MGAMAVAGHLLRHRHQALARIKMLHTVLTTQTDATRGRLRGSAQKRATSIVKVVAVAMAEEAAQALARIKMLHTVLTRPTNATRGKFKGNAQKHAKFLGARSVVSAFSFEAMQRKVTRLT